MDAGGRPTPRIRKWRSYLTVAITRCRTGRALQSESVRSVAARRRVLHDG